jgi:hypothetical protein
MLKESNKKL